jgi:hypothetical protein
LNDEIGRKILIKNLQKQKKKRMRIKIDRKKLKEDAI